MLRMVPLPCKCRGGIGTCFPLPAAAASRGEYCSPRKDPMNRSTLLLAAASLAGFAGTALAAPRAPAPAAAHAPASEGERLARLFRESDEASLRRNPLNAI